MSPKTEWSEGKGTCDVAIECPPWVLFEQAHEGKGVRLLPPSYGHY